MCENKNENEKTEGKSGNPKSRAERLENLKDKAEVLRKDFIDCILAVVPHETVKHLGNSKKELLLAVKSLIDTEIDKIDGTLKDIDTKQ